jgi:hypothetical protein
MDWTVSDQRLLASLDPAEGIDFGFEWSGTNTDAIVIDDVDSYGADAIIGWFKQ